MLSCYKHVPFSFGSLRHELGKTFMTQGKTKTVVVTYFPFLPFLFYINCLLQMEWPKPRGTMHSDDIKFIIFLLKGEDCHMASICLQGYIQTKILWQTVLQIAVLQGCCQGHNVVAWMWGTLYNRALCMYVLLLLLWTEGDWRNISSSLETLDWSGIKMLGEVTRGQEMKEMDQIQSESHGRDMLFPSAL